MRSGQQRFRAVADLGGRPQLGGWCVCGVQIGAELFGIGLVEPGGEPFGQPAGVGEYDRGPVFEHELYHRFVHVRPQRTGLFGITWFGHIGNRDPYREFEGFGCRRRDDGERGGAHQEPPHLFGWSHGRRETDTLGRRVGELVEPSQREAQMRAAFGTGDRVHFVHDHRSHAGQCFPGRGGEHQEQGFRGRDQDVRWVAVQRPAPGRGGIAGPHPDADFRRRQPQPSRGLLDPDQR